MKIINRVGERLLPRWLRNELRPVLAFAGAGTTLWSGSCELVRRGWAELGERCTVWERLGVLAAGGYLTVYGCAHAPHAAVFAAPAVLLAWCVAAWWVAPAAAPELAVETASGTDPTAPAEHTPEDVYAATLDWIRQQIGDRQGVHLRDLLEHAQAHGLLEGLDVTEFRGHLERHGIPVRNRVRVRGLGVTVGVHRDDLPPLAESSPGEDGQDPPKPQLHVA